MNMMIRPEKWIPTLKYIQVAAYRIEKHINITPVLTSSTINDMTGARIHFKCENFQKVGAFKFRGATNAVLSLSKEDAVRGVATHSSGNHAQALALAARNRGIPAYIVMPDNSPKVKVDAVKSYGAHITFCKPTLEDRELRLKREVVRSGATFIHPYNDPRIITGQASAALELIDEIDDLDIIMAPVGGGGLLSGTALSTKFISPNTKVIGAEPLNADDAYRSFKTGKLVPSNDSVSEHGIIEAMRTIWERMKIIVEPSAAVPLGALLEKKVDVKGKKVGIILSGGNVDLDRLPWQKNVSSDTKEQELEC